MLDVKTLSCNGNSWYVHGSTYHKGLHKPVMLNRCISKYDLTHGLQLLTSNKSLFTCFVVLLVN